MVSNGGSNKPKGWYPSVWCTEDNCYQPTLKANVWVLQSQGVVATVPRLGSTSKLKLIRTGPPGLSHCCNYRSLEGSFPAIPNGHVFFPERPVNKMNLPLATKGKTFELYACLSISLVGSHLNSQDHTRKDSRPGGTDYRGDLLE